MDARVVMFWDMLMYWMLPVQVFQDGAVVPGWEGKIVAWVEEDHGERR